MVLSKKLLAEIGTDRFPVGGRKFLDLAVEPPPDDLEVEHRIPLDLAGEDFPEFSFGPGCTEPGCNLPDSAGCHGLFFMRSDKVSRFHEART